MCAEQMYAIVFQHLLEGRIVKLITIVSLEF